MQKNSLFLFTHEYPYRTGESFIENELKLLSQDFQTVYLFPLTNRGEARPLPAQNIKVVYLFEKQKIQKWKLLANNFILIVQILFFEFRSTSSTINFLKSLSLLKSILLINIHRANTLNEFITKTKEKGNNIVFYSFWTDDWATVLSILKQQKLIESFSSRVHGYDLYKERWPDLIIPFRDFQIRNVSKIFAVSKDGLTYLQRNYPYYKDKFYLNHLGISDHGKGPFDLSKIFTIVSCSNLIPLKRVHLIAEILAKVHLNIKWVHFGEGLEKDRLMELVKKMPSNVTVELRGSVANKEIIKYYQSHTINLFIHLSETEGGVPIALQEAASFGIPLIGTNAGGIPEIVTKETGLLIPIAFEISELANFIDQFNNNAIDTMGIRDSVRNFWIENFNAKKNYNEFIKILFGKTKSID